MGRVEGSDIGRLRVVPSVSTILSFEELYTIGPRQQALLK